MTIQEINRALENQVRTCGLAQSIRIVSSYLRLFYPKCKADELYSRISFRANPSLAFPKSELSSIYLEESEEGVQAFLVLNFMALFGSTSPMPTHYSETVLHSIDHDKVLVDFLDMFNHHLQKFVYPIWEKQRYYIQYQRDLSDKFSKYMLSILGLYSQSQHKTNNLDFLKLMPYIGILSMRQKPAASLVSIIRHYLSHDAIDIEQCIQTTIKIQQQQHVQLGFKNSVLGSDVLIGESVKSRSGKFRIIIDDIKWDELYAFSVLGKKIKELKELIQFALKEPLQYDVSLMVAKEQIQTASLDENIPIFLGINSWVGQATEDEKIIFQQ